MSKNKDFYPLAEVNGEVVDDVTFNMSLPEYFPDEEVMVNPARMGRLARLGGFSDSILTTHSGDVTSYEPGISGIDSQGTAVSSNSAKSKKAELSRSEWQSEDPTHTGLLYAFDRPFLPISVNMSEVEENISREDGGVRNPKLLSEQFDAAIKQSIVKSSTENLVTKDTGSKKAHFLFYTSAPVAVGSLFGLSHTEMLRDVALFHIAWGNFMNAFAGSQYGMSPKEQKLSLIMGMQFDRQAAVYALAKTQKLVKAENN